MIALKKFHNLTRKYQNECEKLGFSINDEYKIVDALSIVINLIMIKIKKEEDLNVL